MARDERYDSDPENSEPLNYLFIENKLGNIKISPDDLVQAILFVEPESILSSASGEPFNESQAMVDLHDIYKLLFITKVVFPTFLHRNANSVEEAFNLRKSRLYTKDMWSLEFSAIAIYEVHIDTRKEAERQYYFDLNKLGKRMKRASHPSILETVIKQIFQGSRLADAIADVMNEQVANALKYGMHDEFQASRSYGGPSSSDGLDPADAEESSANGDAVQRAATLPAVTTRPAEQTERTEHSSGEADSESDPISLPEEDDTNPKSPKR